MKLNFSQYFADGEEDNDSFKDLDSYFSDGELDLDKFQSDFESSFVADDEDEETEDTEPVEETPEDVEEVEETQDPIEEDVKEPESQPQFPNDKQNKAFAEMRKKVQSLEKYEGFLGKLAERQGMTPEQLMETLNERIMEDEAKAQGMSVDVYKRINQLEQENLETKKQAFAEKFNTDVATTKEKYGLNEQDIDNVFTFMHQNNFVDDDGFAKIGFGQAYILANSDNLMKQAEERGRQSYLESKKQRQEGAVVPVTGGQSTQTEPADYSEEDVFKFLKEHDINF